MSRMVFPFTAIVGQEKAKLALLCNAVNLSIGGILLSSDKYPISYMPSNVLRDVDIAVTIRAWAVSGGADITDCIRVRIRKPDYRD